ncbi:VCBS repeat-containing protein [Lewinella lacunae]|uniref:VCBS repeat-containing protein n=1 Tax=Neolewinella lacunae TaxID=1517758 RepID=A0A923PP92_9BACT|nr:VCBS repeat-containing protein [Neolewinella lacunae]
MYEYFYNGGGVAAGDLNGDGKTDLYFTANMAENRLYLNAGDLHFTDVTQPSGAGGRPGPWKTGVTLADVNADGKLDIYLCYSGMLPPEKRANQLFINQGNGPDGVPVFRDEAAAYGLAGTAFSNQMYFFDYDRDGDLDGLLLNHNPQALPVLNAAKTRELLANPDPDRGLRLYQNTGGKFKDVTEAAGISGSALSYGLGLAIADLDNDGDPDFYVSNDYEVPDYLYYNNGDGTFTDHLGEQMSHTSHFSMGSDAGDINNDGHLDLFTLDMLPADPRRQRLLQPDDNRSKLDLNLASGFHHQTMRNMLQLNRGDGTFAEIGRLAGVAMTDWSWSALLADFDNDGWQDLHVTNGYLKDYTNLDFIKYMEDFTAAKGRLQRTDLRELLEQMPASDLRNFAFGNQHNGTFADRTADWGLARPSNSNGAVYADLDNDGDLDLVVNNLDRAAFVYRNDLTGQNYLSVALEGPAGNPQGIGARVEIRADDLQQIREQFPNRGYLSCVDPVLHFGLGARTQVQRLVVTWPDGARQNLEAVEVNQRIVLRHQEAGEVRPAPAKATAPSWFREVSSPLAYTDPPAEQRGFDEERLLPREYAQPGPVLAVEGGKVLAKAGTGRVLARSSGKYAVEFVGNAYLPGRYPLVDAVTLYPLNDGQRTPLTSPLPQELQSIGKINAATWADLDGDGADELVVAGEWTPLLCFTFDGQQLQPYAGAFPPPLTGWWTALHLSDFNGDGRLDLLAGNQGLNNLFSASPELPLELYAADLDGNGALDPILSYYGPDGRRYADLTRDELLGQLAGLRKKYPDYRSFADQSLDDIFPSWPEGTLHRTAEMLETVLYLSQADGRYARAELPLEVQYAPVHTITAADFNADGHRDLLLCGNDGKEKQRWGKAEANTGILLQGDGKGGFGYVPQATAGLKLRGDVRSVLAYQDLLLFGIRGKKVRAYRREAQMVEQ